MTEKKCATDRREDESCQKLTPGCCVDHACDDDDDSCETW